MKEKNHVHLHHDGAPFMYARLQKLSAEAEPPVNYSAKFRHLARLTPTSELTANNNDCDNDNDNGKDNDNDTDNDNNEDFGA